MEKAIKAYRAAFKKVYSTEYFTESTPAGQSRPIGAAVVGTDKIS